MSSTSSTMPNTIVPKNRTSIIFENGKPIESIGHRLNRSNTQKGRQSRTRKSDMPTAQAPPPPPPSTQQASTESDFSPSNNNTNNVTHSRKGLPKPQGLPKPSREQRNNSHGQKLHLPYLQQKSHNINVYLPYHR
eukprot:UN20503